MLFVSDDVDSFVEPKVLSLLVSELVPVGDCSAVDGLVTSVVL